MRSTSQKSTASWLPALAAACKYERFTASESISCTTIQPDSCMQAQPAPSKSGQQTWAQGAP